MSVTLSDSDTSALACAASSSAIESERPRPPTPDPAVLPEDIAVGLAAADDPELVCAEGRYDPVASWSEADVQSRERGVSVDAMGGLVVGRLWESSSRSSPPAEGLPPTPSPRTGRPACPSSTPVPALDARPCSSSLPSSSLTRSTTLLGDAGRRKSASGAAARSSVGRRTGAVHRRRARRSGDGDRACSDSGATAGGAVPDSGSGSTRDASDGGRGASCSSGSRSGTWGERDVTGKERDRFSCAWASIASQSTFSSPGRSRCSSNSERERGRSERSEDEVEDDEDDDVSDSVSVSVNVASSSIASSSSSTASASTSSSPSAATAASSSSLTSSSSSRSSMARLAWLPMDLASVRLSRLARSDSSSLATPRPSVTDARPAISSSIAATVRSRALEVDRPSPSL